MLKDDEKAKLLADYNSIAARKDGEMKFTAAELSEFVKKSQSDYYRNLRGMKDCLQRKADLSGGDGLNFVKPDAKSTAAVCSAAKKCSARKKTPKGNNILDTCDPLSTALKTGNAAYERKTHIEKNRREKEEKERLKKLAAATKSKMQLIDSFMRNSNFTSAEKACKELVELNPQSAEAHFKLFLARNKLKDISELEYAEYVTYLDDWGAAVDCADDEERETYVVALRDYIEYSGDIDTYSTYINYDDDLALAESLSEKLVDRVKRNDEVTDDDINDLDTILDSMHYDDFTARICLNFGKALLQIDIDMAIQYIKRAHDINNSRETAYWYFVARNDLATDEDIEEFCTDYGNRDIIKEEVYYDGSNVYATKEFMRVCVAGDASQEGAEFFDFLLDLLPEKLQSPYDIANYVEKYVTKLIGEGYFECAAVLNKRIAPLEKNFKHNVHFNDMLIKNRVSQLVRLVEKADTILDDPDYYKAIAAYAEYYPSKENNYYIEVAERLQKANDLITDKKCRQYVYSHLTLTRSNLYDAEKLVRAKVADYKQEKKANETAQRAATQREQFEREEQERRRNEQERREEAARLANLRGMLDRAIAKIDKKQSKHRKLAIFLNFLCLFTFTATLFFPLKIWFSVIPVALRVAATAFLIGLIVCGKKGDSRGITGIAVVQLILTVLSVFAGYVIFPKVAGLARYVSAATILPALFEIAVFFPIIACTLRDEDVCAGWGTTFSVFGLATAIAGIVLRYAFTDYDDILPFLVFGLISFGIANIICGKKSERYGMMGLSIAKLALDGILVGISVLTDNFNLLIAPFFIELLTIFSMITCVLEDEEVCFGWGIAFAVLGVIDAIIGVVFRYSSHNYQGMLIAVAVLMALEIAIIICGKKGDNPVMMGIAIAKLALDGILMIVGFVTGNANVLCAPCTAIVAVIVAVIVIAIIGAMMKSSS